MHLTGWPDGPPLLDGWPALAAALHQNGWLPAAAVGQVALIWWFGRLIANTDMHEGNLSFHPGLSLAPVYDMLPMRYRPRDEDPMPDPGFEPPAPHAGVLEAWATAVPAAALFWERVAAAPQVSAAFRHIAGRNRASVNGLSSLPPSASTR